MGNQSVNRTKDSRAEADDGEDFSDDSDSDKKEKKKKRKKSRKKSQISRSRSFRDKKGSQREDRAQGYIKLIWNNPNNNKKGVL